MSGTEEHILLESVHEFLALGPEFLKVKELTEVHPVGNYYSS